MTQPPYGDQPQPPYGDQPQPPSGRPSSRSRRTATEPQPTYGEPPHYPHQELLPQHVQPRRSRLPQSSAPSSWSSLVAALVVWRVVHDNGEDNRAAYCSALKKLTSRTDSSGLAEDVGSGGGTVPKAVTDLVALAPAVSGAVGRPGQAGQQRPDGVADVEHDRAGPSPTCERSSRTPTRIAGWTCSFLAEGLET